MCACLFVCACVLCVCVRAVCVRTCLYVRVRACKQVIKRASDVVTDVIYIVFIQMYSTLSV